MKIARTGVKSGRMEGKKMEGDKGDKDVLVMRHIGKGSCSSVEECLTMQRINLQIIFKIKGII